VLDSLRTAKRTELPALLVQLHRLLGSLGLHLAAGHPETWGGR
jgi:hypothetical protein